MLKSGLIAAVCALGLIAAPVMAAGTTAMTPVAAAGKTGTHHHKAMTHVSAGTGHAMHSGHAGGKASAQDHMADQLNGQSLQAAAQGRPFTAGAGGMSQPTPTAKP
jgi:hypothetical protein